jgi:comEA protein
MRIAGLLVLIIFLPAVAYAALININTADATLLDTLPGIGPSKAAAIIDYRTQQGPFVVITDIQNVSGIGSTTFANIQTLITVDTTDVVDVTESAVSPPPQVVEPIVSTNTEVPLSAPATASSPVDINTADAVLLDTLPGIGPSKATAIVDYRTQNGLFTSIADIQNVAGIGPSTFANIKTLITVGDVVNTPLTEPIPEPAPPIQKPLPPVPASPQPLASTTSYKKIQAVESPTKSKIEPVINTKTNTQTHDDAVDAPTVVTELAAVGAAFPTSEPLPSSDARSSGIFHSIWTLGLLGVIVAAGAVFILL